MSKLRQLQGKAQMFKIGGIDLELKPLSVDDLDLMNVDQNAPTEEQMKATKKLVHKVLKDSVPDATDEEINNISLEHMEELMNAITKLHKFGDDKLQMLKDAAKARHQAKSNK